MTVEYLAEEVEEAFNRHYQRTPSEPNAYEYACMSDRELDYDWDRDGEATVYAIMNAANISEDLASVIQGILQEKHDDREMSQMGEETEFCEEAHYEEKAIDASEWEAQWREFEQAIKTQTRFFDRTASELLESVFGDLDSFETTDRQRLIINAGPNETISGFYRARAFETNDALEEALKYPETHIGPPLPKLARAGRMNAQGISVFYGADESETAIAEIRPAVGSRVAMAKFDLTRQIRLLDLRALERMAARTGSIFDPEYSQMLQKISFIRGLSSIVSRPVTPFHEPLEYIPTQAIADFLSNHLMLNLDGIIYPSVQSGDDAFNVVLFNKAARILPVLRPYGIEMSVSAGHQVDEDEWEVDYTVVETCPDDPRAEATQNPPSIRQPLDFPWGQGGRSTLEIDLSSLSVHEIEKVTVSTSAYPVSRHRLSQNGTASDF